MLNCYSRAPRSSLVLCCIVRCVTRQKNCFNDKDESLELCNLPFHEKTETFRCVTSNKEVAAECRCDLFVGCADESDEMGCETCRFGLCSDGLCVPQTWLIDSQQDCLTISGQSRPDMENSINFEMDCIFVQSVKVCTVAQARGRRGGLCWARRTTQRDTGNT